MSTPKDPAVSMSEPETQKCPTCGSVCRVEGKTTRYFVPNTEVPGKSAQEMAIEYALSVEWKGDDYGARKLYYRDAWLAGHAAGRAELEAKNLERLKRRILKLKERIQGMGVVFGEDVGASREKK